MERNVVVQIIINGLFKIYTSYSGDAKKKKKEIECFFFSFCSIRLYSRGFYKEHGCYKTPPGNENFPAFSSDFSPQ